MEVPFLARKFELESVHIGCFRSWVLFMLGKLVFMAG